MSPHQAPGRRLWQILIFLPLYTHFSHRAPLPPLGGSRGREPSRSRTGAVSGGQVPTRPRGPLTDDRGSAGGQGGTCPSGPAKNAFGKIRRAVVPDGRLVGCPDPRSIVLSTHSPGNTRSPGRTTFRNPYAPTPRQRRLEAHRQTIPERIRSPALGSGMGSAKPSTEICDEAPASNPKKSN